MSWAESSWILSNQAPAGAGLFDRTAFEFQEDMDLYTGSINYVCVCKFIAPEDGIYRYTYDVFNGTTGNFTHSLNFMFLNFFPFVYEVTASSASIWYYGQNQTQLKKYIALILGEAASVTISSVYSTSNINALLMYSDETIYKNTQKTFEWYIRAKKGDAIAFVMKSANLPGVVLKNQKVTY